MDVHESRSTAAAARAATAAPILVSGGTGTLGRLVVKRLEESGTTVRVLSRRDHEGRDGVQFITGDLSTGAGVEQAVEGIETVIHCAGASKGDDITTGTLVRVARRAGVRHLVFISVVGADRVPVVSRADRVMFGYFASKRAAERVVEESGIPWTMLRATQFYDLILLVTRQMARLPLIPLPTGFRFQPVDTDEVAERLVELAHAAPAELVPDIAGPTVYTTAELLHAYLHAAGKRRSTVPLHLPGRAARAVRAGANLAPDRRVGRRTWEQFLAEHVAAPASSAAQRGT